MKKSYIERYALYNAVEVELNNGDKFKGWLVSEGHGYVLLPLNDIWNKYYFNTSFIKEITHLTNNVKINKLAKEIEASETGFITPDTRKIFGNNLTVRDLTEKQADRICKYMFHTYGEYKDDINYAPMKDICIHCPLAIRTSDSEFTCMNGRLERYIDENLLKIIKENTDGAD